MNNNKTKDVIVVGFALFSMFFGAGNLIFPPSLGLAVGSNWAPALIGFLLTGIGIPLLGIIASSKAGGSLSDLADKVSPTFSKILGTAIMLAIGPFLAIPRTGATTFEMGVKPFLTSSSSIIPIVVSIIYFGITLFLVINPSDVVDKVGKILTPILLVSLFVIIVKGIITPIASPVDMHATHTFSRGFLEGYQTMDALASMVFAGIIISSLVQKGYKDTKDQVKLTIMSGLLAAFALAIVYGGLMYLGATASGVLPQDMSKTTLVVTLTNKVLGKYGNLLISIAVSLACLTTAIGLTATCGEYFSKLSNGKLSYRAVVIIVTLFSCVVSNFGVETIVKIAVPILVTVYPVGIILIVFNIFDNFIKNKAIYKGAISGALLISVFDALKAAGLQIPSIYSLLSKIPLSASGFGWIIPAVIGSIIAVILSKKTLETNASSEAA